jgi:hypothetical protein
MTIDAMMQGLDLTDRNDPLLDPGVLQNVLGYVGPGHCLFVAPVNKLWNGIYAALQSLQLAVSSAISHKKIITCVPQMTLYSAVFASPSRVQLAHTSGLSCNSAAYQYAAGKDADIATLATAHKLGMEYSEITMACAAQCNKLAEVQYLHAQGCPWSLRLLEDAARGGHFELVRWCHKQGCPWKAKVMPHHAAESGNVELMAWVLQQPGIKLSKAVKSRAASKGSTALSKAVMSRAASKGRTAMCQYLRTQQCPWSASSTYYAADNGHVDVLRWLMDNGCPWDANNLRLAAVTSGSVDVLEFLQLQGF